MSEATVMKGKPVVKFFVDKECRIPFPDSTLELADIVELGKSGELLTYMQNISGNYLDNIQVYTGDKDVRITQERKELNPNEVCEVKIVFTPSPTREQALNTPIHVAARIVMRP